MLSKHFLIASFCIFLFINSYGVPSKLRLAGIGDLSTQMSLIFDSSVNGDYNLETNPKVYYGTNYTEVNNLSSVFVTPTSVNTNSWMRNNICRLANLQPNTIYYFKVADDNGTTETYHFETLPNDNTPLSIIAGGDSRNNRSVRVSANKMVAKLKPHAILFTGDFTDTGNPQEWQWWFEDWQYTIDSANRIIPIIPTRGNHEGNDNFLIDLFGAPENVYYTSSNNSLLTVITLNTEKAMNAYTEQTNWLINTLAQINTTYKIAQYHKPMRPHIKSYGHGATQYTYWAKTLEDYEVDMVVESDSHTSKTTWPIVVCSGGLNCDEGFKRDYTNGVVYTGEGGWGSPLRYNDNNKSWTRSSGMYNQFKLIFIDEYGMELRTVLVDNEPQVTEVDVNNRFNLPPKQNIWTTGEVVYSQNKNSNIFPEATLVYPQDNTLLYNLSAVEFQANAADTNGSIQKVKFYVNGNLVHQDFSYPYKYSYKPPNFGHYLVHVIATNSSGLTSCIDMAAFSILDNTTVLSGSSKINTTTDDAEEYSNGYMDLLNWDIDLGYNGYTCGFRFQNMDIPPGALVTGAHIQFTADEVKTNSTYLNVYGERNANAKTFFIDYNDISNRAKTTNMVDWYVDAWTQVGASGSAQSTPNLKNILNEIIALPGYEFGNPFAFIIEGFGYRVTETFDGEPEKAAVLHYTYQLPNYLINVLPGDADNNGIVDCKDVLYACLNFTSAGPTRSNASINWNAQPVMPWNSFMNGINLAHQDTDGNGLINEKDMDAVVFNYGKGNLGNNPPIEYQTNVLKLRQSYSNISGVNKYEIFLDTENYVKAHGIHGSIDLSEFLKIDKDIVHVNTNPYNFFNPDVVFSKYHEDTKILDFALSKTDQQGSSIQNKGLLTIAIGADDLIEGDQVKKASIKYSALISADGRYESLKGANFYVLESSNVNFNLITIDAHCYQNGAAEIQMYNDDINTYEYVWSNGMNSSKVDSLVAGDYTLTIKKAGNLIETVDFEIATVSGISEMVIVDQDVTKDSVIKASTEITIQNNVEISKNYNVELLIDGCE